MSLKYLTTYTCEQTNSLNMESQNHCDDRSIYTETNRGDKYEKIKLIMEAMKAIQMRKHNYRLAENLMTLLLIRTGNEIVPLIGNGKEKSNRDALITWVEIHAEDFTGLSFSVQLDLLASQLRKDLIKAQDRIMFS